MILKKYWSTKKAKVKFDALTQYLNPSCSVLLIGMGDGALANLLVQYGVKVKGLDHSYRNIFTEDVEVKLYSGKSIPYTINTFDVVLFNDSLKDSVKPERLVAQAAIIARQQVLAIEKVPLSNSKLYKAEEPEWNAGEKCLKKRMEVFNRFAKEKVTVENFPYFLLYDYYLYHFMVDEVESAKVRRSFLHHF